MKRCMIVSLMFAAVAMLAVSPWIGAPWTAVPDPSFADLPGLPILGMAGLIVNQGTLADLFTGFNAAFNTGFRLKEALWPKVATLVNSATKEEHYAWIGQFPRLREWIGERQLKGLAAFDYRIKNKKFESTIAVPRDDIEDDTYGVWSQQFAELGYSALVHPDELLFAQLKAGFATVCYDGQYFFDTDHPVAGVANGSNSGGGAGTNWFLLDVSRPLKPLIFQKRREYVLKQMVDLQDERVFMSEEFRYGVDARCNVGYGFWQQAYGSKQTLDAAAYAAARAAMMSLLSDEGRPLGITPNLLVVPPALETAGRTILLAETQANGATNPWKGTAELLVTPWVV